MCIQHLHALTTAIDEGNQAQFDYWLSQIDDLDVIIPGDVNQSLGGLTPLMVAVNADQIEMAKALVAKGADIDFHDNTAHDETAVSYATVRGTSDMLMWLLENNANTDIKDGNGRKPFDVLLDHLSETQDEDESEDFAQRIDFLLDHGLELDKESAMHEHLHDKQLKVVLKMLSLGADVNQQDQNGNTLLMKIPFTDEHHLEMAHTLLDYGAKVMLCNQHGENIFDVLSSSYSFLRDNEGFSELNERLLCCRDNEILGDQIVFTAEKPAYLSM